MGAPWAFVEGSVSVTASILYATAISWCDGCGGWPVIGFFKKLTEQEDGVNNNRDGSAVSYGAEVFTLGARWFFRLTTSTKGDETP